HWPTKFVGDSLRVKSHFSDDEASTPLTTVMLLRVGGKQGASSQGIHWHVDPDIRIRYKSDDTRETMYEVELTGDDGSVRTYRNPAQSSADVEGSEEIEWRTMDCVDCHNRPSHVYRLPEQEVDAAIESGLISRDLPFIRREGVRILQAEYDSHEAARIGIAEALRTYYRANHADVAAALADRIEEAAEQLGEFYCSNVFPAMKVTWGTYPDHIGHTISDGCFRCHNDEHITDAGDVISQDCSTCHALLALEEEDPEILAMLTE
ncbi:MAG: cytochrome C, partial [bacterium]|nr:cytochrome C [bacterium]